MRKMLNAFLLLVLAMVVGHAAGADPGRMIAADEVQWQEMSPGSPLKMAIP